MKKKIFLIVLTVLGYAGAYGQSQRIEVIREKIAKQLQVDLKQIPDSIPFYGFAFEIELQKRQGHIKVLSISLNDSLAGLIVKDYNFLKKIDYSSEMAGFNEVRLIIPVVVAAFNSNTGKKVSSMYRKEFSANVERLFNYRETDGKDLTQQVLLYPFIIYSDKTVYN